MDRDFLDEEGRVSRWTPKAEYLNLNSNSVGIAPMDAWTEVSQDTGIDP
jgi:hypothetical protein